MKRCDKTAKGLQSQLLLIEGEIVVLKTEVRNKQKELGLKCKTATSLKEQIEKLNHPTEPQVSEHATLRYLERVRGINIEEVKKEILNPKLLDILSRAGTSLKWKEDGIEVVVKDNVVVTVI